MNQRKLKKPKNGCLWVILIFIGIPIIIPIISLPIAMPLAAISEFKKGNFVGGVGISLLFIGLCYGAYKVYLWKKGKRKPKQNIPNSPDALELSTSSGKIRINNPFRGVFIVGSAGSGKSESIGVPLLNQFISKGFAGIVYDFKFPTLANDVQAFLDANRSGLRHYFLNFNNPYQSNRVNPLNPVYLPNTSYAREYAQALISNLMKESIKKPDFWSRSATDLLTACIWYLKEEHPDKCDLPHVCAMITSNDTLLLEILQTNATTAQMTISIYNAMKRGAEGQTAGVIGTLQGVIAQINTPEIMYIFGADDFSLNVNDPDNPILLTVGTYPTLVNTFSPLCSLVITVATKLMNQPNKHKSFVLLDEAPTCYIPNLEILPNTARSNKVSPVIMCQDLSQLTDGYGKEKSEVLFAACNNHFYGRVSSSHTSEILSKQFGKIDRTFISQSVGQQQNKILGKHYTQSESVQERDIIKPAEFLNFNVGEFAGIVVESNAPTFREHLQTCVRPPFNGLQQIEHVGDVNDYYRKVRAEIEEILSQSKKMTENGSHNPVLLNETQTNSKADEKGSVFDIFGD